jgi:hypothetical protein
LRYLPLFSLDPLSQDNYMPIQYIVLEQGMLVYARAYGSLDTEDLVEHERSILQDKSVKNGFKQLLDCRWVKADLIYTDVVTVLRQLHSQHKARLRGARYGIVTHNTTWFQIGTLYDCDRYGMTMIVFNDPSTACIWLGVDYDDIVQYVWLDVAPMASERAWVAEVPA